jgi:hypothetical protein
MISVSRFILSLVGALGRTYRVGWSAWIGILLFSTVGAADSVSHLFDITVSNAETALKEFSFQSGQQIVVPTELLDGVRTHAVHGEWTEQAALDRMFLGTPLVAVADTPSGAFAIVRRSSRPRKIPILNAAAIIVIGLAADQTQAQRFRRDADAARAALTARGIPSTAIKTLPAELTSSPKRDEIFAAFRTLPPSLDESWLVMMGQVTLGRVGPPTFQISGPHLSAQDFAEAANELPGKKYLVLAMAKSGSFLPFLLGVPKSEVVAATTEVGEVNEPRFAEMWSSALAANPDASFRDLATEAAIRVEEFYRSHHLDQAEHAQRIDRTTGRIVAADAMLP